MVIEDELLKLMVIKVIKASLKPFTLFIELSNMDETRDSIN